MEVFAYKSRPQTLSFSQGKYADIIRWKLFITFSSILLVEVVQGSEEKNLVVFVVISENCVEYVLRFITVSSTSVILFCWHKSPH